MGHQDGVKGIRYKEVCGLRIGLMHVYHSMYFYYLLLFVIYVLPLDKLGDLLMYLSYIIIYMSDCRCLDWEVTSTLGNY